MRPDDSLLSHCLSPLPCWACFPFVGENGGCHQHYGERRIIRETFRGFGRHQRIGAAGHRALSLHAAASAGRILRRGRVLHRLGIPDRHKPHTVPEHDRNAQPRAIHPQAGGAPLPRVAPADPDHRQRRLAVRSRYAGVHPRSGHHRAAGLLQLVRHRHGTKLLRPDESAGVPSSVVHRRAYAVLRDRAVHRMADVADSAHAVCLTGPLVADGGQRPCHGTDVYAQGRSHPRLLRHRYARHGSDAGRRPRLVGHRGPAGQHRPGARTDAPHHQFG